MKWLNRLSHRFWLWVDRRIEHHKFLEGITGEYPFMVEPNVSVKITSEEIEAKKQALQEAMNRHLETSFTDPTFLDRAVGFDGLSAIVDDNTDGTTYDTMTRAPFPDIENEPIRKGYDKH